MVAMETGHFLKMLNDASLASLGFVMRKVLGCIICKNPLWVLSCKVGPKLPVWLPDYAVFTSVLVEPDVSGHDHFGTLCTGSSHGKSAQAPIRL